MNCWLGELPPGIKAKAWRRSDVYGTYAQNSRSTLTQLRLILVSFTLVPLKVVACLTCVLACFICVSFGNATLREPYKTKYMVFWGQVWTRALLCSLGFWRFRWLYVSPDGSQSSTPPPGLSARKFGGYVSNHCSWVDIVLYMSRLFPSFVAKIEVSTLPLIGPISKAMQCLFVDRAARLAAAQDAAGGGGGQGMSQLVKERMVRKYAESSCELPMLLFPEGTTTNNRFLMPFKRGAFVAGVPVQPLVLKYDQSGRFWPTWDALPGPLHIYLMMTEVAFSATCYVLPLYEPSEEEVADASLYAENVRRMMTKYCKIPTCDDTFADKLAFFKHVTDRIEANKQGRQGGPKVAGAAVAGSEEPGAPVGAAGGVAVAQTAGAGLRQRKFGDEVEDGKGKEMGGARVMVRAVA